MWDKKTLQQDNETITYYDTGGNGPTLVLSHGFFMNANMWKSQVEYFRSNYRVIAIDARGFGGSTASQPFTYWDLAKDIHGILSAENFESVHLVGHSQGGFTTLRFALTYPENVASLILFDTEATACTQEEIDGYNQLFSLFRTGEVPTEVLDSLSERLIGDKTVAARWSPEWPKIPWETLQYSANALTYRDEISDRIGKINSPVLLISGSEDQNNPPAKMRQLSLSLSGSDPQLRTVEGAAHTPPLTYPNESNYHLEKFLDAVLSSQ